MSRGIKFRAWETFDDGSGFFVNEDEWITVDQGGNVWDDGDVNTGIIIEQFTGLRDKNGKEIYEGDIVLAKVTIEVSDGEEFSYYQSDEEGNRTKHCCKPKPSVVEYTDRGYICKHSSGKSVSFWLYRPDEAEVIGNIHENPELLEQ
jgi:uncharacterized phage protein (TIGR01671 family)